MDAPLIGGRTLLLGQADPRRQEPRPTLRPKDTRRRGVKSLFGSGLGSTFDPTRTVARAGHQRFNTGIALIDAAGRAGEAGDRDLHIELLWLVAVRTMWTDPGEAMRRVLADAARRLGNAQAEDPRVVAIYAYADPFGHAPEVVVRLRAALASGGHDPEPARHFGAAAFIVGAFDLAQSFWRIAVDGLRSDGRLGYLPRALTVYGTVAARHANWDVALPAADEGRRLALEFADPMWEAGSETVASTIAGMRGDNESAVAAAEKAEQYGLTAGVHWTVALAQAGRSLAALAMGRHEEAYESSEAPLRPG